MIEFVITAILGLGGTVIVCLSLETIRERLAAYRCRRADAGKTVSVAARVSLSGGRLRRARLSRDGDRLLVRTWKRVFALPLSTGPVTCRIVEPAGDFDGQWRLERYTDPARRVVEVGVLAADRSVLAVLREKSAVRRPHLPFWASCFAGLCLLGALLLSVLYGVSYDATAIVREVNDDASSCLVEWTHGERTRLTHVDCGSYDAGQSGMTVPIVAQPEPFAGQAFSGERSEIVGIDSTMLVVAGLILGFGAWRARSPRRTTVLSPLPVLESHPDQTMKRPALSVASPVGRESVLPDTVLGLAAQITGVQGWDAAPAHRRTQPSSRTDVLDAVTSVAWWMPLCGVGAAMLVDVPYVRTLLWALAAIFFVVDVVRTIRRWMQLHAIWRLPVSSEWDGVGLPAPEGYAVLLCLGATPYWLVEVGDMPPALSRFRVRGQLSGDVVHLLPVDSDHVLIGRPERFTDELAEAVNCHLRDVLEEFDLTRDG